MTQKDLLLTTQDIFYNLNKELLESILNYLKREAPNQMNTAALQTLETNGVGINQFMHLLKEMSETSMQLPSFHSTSV